jgi:hypothetical protein
LRRSFGISPAKVDELGRVGNLLASARFLDEAGDVLFYVTVLEGETHLLA